MSKEDFNARCLQYHAEPVAGKIRIESSKSCETQDDLAMAYTPGVAQPCLAIKENIQDVYRYTSKGNLVAVVSDGTAVLGLGNIGPEAGLPVMEGKAVLFKRFADIDTVPICLGHCHNESGKTDVEKVISVTQTLEPTFGGINLEDIAAPGCFEIESRLKGMMNIPVFHDDQHGTAIISLAGLLNALELSGKKIEDIQVVVNGAGAAGLACSEFYISAGVKRENLVICDSKGVVYKGRPGHLTAQKERLATERNVRTLAEALVGADMFLGCSVGNCVTPEMVKSMAPNPILFAMANPTPEIFPQDAYDAGAFVVGTGRTDFPNQINNVLGFPGIFRGALDTRASDINEAMKLAASKALAELAKLPVEGEVRKALELAYPKDAASGMFDGACPLSRFYVIPKPFDPRVVPHVARYVAEAAMATGVAQQRIDDLEAYEASVAARIRNR